MATSVLITGASGLIGTAVKAQWPNELGQLADCEIDGERLDLLAAGAPERMLAELRPDLVLHLAWVASSTAGYRSDARNPEWARATEEIAHHCLMRDVRFIGTRSVVEMMSTSDAYSSAKRRIRASLDPLIERGAVTWLVPHFVYSVPAGKPSLVHLALRAAAEGRSLPLRCPTEAHDFVDVADVASGIISVVRYGLTGSIEIGSGSLRTAAPVALAVGATLAASSGTWAAAGSTRAADISRLCATGWGPTATKEFFDAQA